MYNVHDNLKHLTAEELKIISDRDRVGLSIMLMNFEHDLNIGNCIRSAHLLGVNTVIIFGRNKIDSRSTVGAHNYVNLVKVAVDLEKETTAAAINTNVNYAFETVLMNLQLFPVFIDKVEGSFDIESSEFKTWLTGNYGAGRKPGYQPCLVFGNESTGIHPAIKPSPCFHINQLGVIRSFNVASAASIAMYKAKTILEV